MRNLIIREWCIFNKIIFLLSSMAIKGQKRRGKTHRRISKGKRTHRRTQRRSIRGGNYSTDITTRTFENFPMKAYNKVVVSVPGRGVM